MLRTGTRAGPLVGAVVLVVLAAGFVIWSLVAFSSAGDDLSNANRAWSTADDRLDAVRADDDLAAARTRDEVNRIGQAAVVTMNTLDYRRVDGDLQAWEWVTAGALHDEVVNLAALSKQTVLQAQSVTKATALSSAVRELDERTGKAVVLVAIKVSVTIKDAEQADKYQRIEGSLEFTEDGWKLSGIAQVPYAAG